MKHLFNLDFWLDILDAWRSEWRATVDWYKSGHYEEPLPERCPWCGQDIQPEIEGEDQGPLTSCAESHGPPGVSSELVYAVDPATGPSYSAIIVGSRNADGEPSVITIRTAEEFERAMGYPPAPAWGLSRKDDAK